MPRKQTIRKAREDKRAGKSASTQAGEFVREEIDKIRRGKHGARSPQQAIAIGLSEARRAGVDLPPPRKGKAKASTRKSAKYAYETGQGKRKPQRRPRVSRAVETVLKKEPRSTVSRARCQSRANARPVAAAPHRARHPPARLPEPKARRPARRPQKRPHAPGRNADASMIRTGEACRKDHAQSNARSAQASRQEAPDRRPERALDRPDHGATCPVGLGDDGIVRHHDPLTIEPNPIVPILGLPVGIGHRKSVGVRAAQAPAAAQAVEPGLERRVGVSTIVPRHDQPGWKQGNDEEQDQTAFRHGC